eukprot:UN26632
MFLFGVELQTPLSFKCSIAYLQYGSPSFDFWEVFSVFITLLLIIFISRCSFFHIRPHILSIMLLFVMPIQPSLSFEYSITFFTINMFRCSVQT